MKMKTLLATTIFGIAPLAGHAVTVDTGSQLDVVGTIDPDNSVFTSTGFVDFDPETGFALRATQDFSSVVTVGEPGAPTEFALYDIDFTAPDKIYEGGGFTFTANSFTNFDNDSPTRGFTAIGVITSALFDPTPATFSFSSQGDEMNVEGDVSFSSTTTAVPIPAAGFLLVGGLGALAALRRRA